MPVKWSLLAAIKVIARFYWGDLYGFMMQRRKLLGKLDITQKGIDAGGRECSYLVNGNPYKTKPVIFLHGSPGNALDWTWFLKKDGIDRTICAINRPGYGLSGGEKPDLGKDAQMIGHILERMTAEHKAVIVGHSLGGGIAAYLAAHYPERVEGLVLVGASLDPDLETIHAIQRVFALPPFCWLLSRSIRNSNRELLQYPEFLISLKKHLPAITCPVDVIHSRDDRLVPFDNVDYMRHYMKNAAIRVHDLEDGGHFLNLSRPELIAEIATKPG